MPQPLSAFYRLPCLTHAGTVKAIPTRVSHNITQIQQHIGLPDGLAPPQTVKARPMITGLGVRLEQGDVRRLKKGEGIVGGQMPGARILLR